MDDFDEIVLKDLPIRPVTRRLVSQLLWDLPLNHTVITDFGVETPNHYRALKAVLLYDPQTDQDQEEDVSFEQLRSQILKLEDALGNGSKLNALVRQYAPDYAPRVSFQTSWDLIYGRTGEAQAQELSDA